MESEEQRSAPRTRARGRHVRQPDHRHPWLRRFGAAGIGLLTLALVLTGAAWIKLNGNIKREDVTSKLGIRPTADKANASTGPLNILVLGSDVRTGKGNTGYGNGSWEPGQHSDTNLVVHLSADRQSAVVVSIPRDSMVPSPKNCAPDQPKSDWVVKQWNKNFNEGGAGCVIHTLEGNTGLFITHYVTVDFNGFKSMVDALGGVPVCTPIAIDDPESKLHLTAGRHVLDGQQALGYVRVRKTLGDGSDLGRIKRQQAFLSSVAQEATKTSLLLRPDKLFSFLNAATELLTTDPEFGLGTMKDVADSVKSIGMNKIQFVTVPTEQYAPDHDRVQWTSGAEALWSALRDDRPINEPAKAKPTPSVTLTVSPAEIDVEVRNGSGVSGLAKQAGEALTVLGFRSVSVAQADAQTTGSLVQYGKGHEDAAKTVAAALPGSKLEESASAGATIVVTLGVGAPDVVEIPNRIGTSPLPTPSISAPAATPTITARTADQDICS
jgi:LCP family protein required for cell wall assembly